jgi:hypothetical protein
VGCSTAAGLPALAPALFAARPKKVTVATTLAAAVSALAFRFRILTTRL